MRCGGSTATSGRPSQATEHDAGYRPRLGRTARRAWDLIRDLHDGSIDRKCGSPRSGRARAPGPTSRGGRAAGRLEAIVQRSAGSYPAGLRPHLIWELDRVGRWGPTSEAIPRSRRSPGRGRGLIASEGRMDDPDRGQYPAGVLDIRQPLLSEVIPRGYRSAATRPETVEANELSEGRHYSFLPTTSGGSSLPDLDLIRCVAFSPPMARPPVIEFLKQGGPHLAASPGKI